MPFNADGEFVLSEDEDLDDVTRAVAHKAKAMAHNNNKMIREIEEAGIIGDYATARVNHLALELVRFGILTEAQYWEIELGLQVKWRSSLREPLMEARRRKAAIQARQKAAKLAVPAKNDKIWTPGQG